MEENGQTQNTLWLKIVLLTLIELTVLAGAFYAGAKFNASKQPPIASTKNQQTVFPTGKFVYNNNGRATLYDFQKNQEIDLGLTGVSQFLWSKNGQLAALVQGKYGVDQGLFRMPKVFASTAGFNYLLYLIDLNGNTPKLILPEVFGEAFWSEDSTSFYVSENYYQGKPLLLYNQSGIEPDEIKTYLVALDGTKRSIDKKGFDKAAAINSERLLPINTPLLTSPDRKFFAFQVEKNEKGEYKYEIVIFNGEGKEIKRLPGRDPSWDPIK